MEASDYPSTSISLRLHANLTPSVVSIEAVGTRHDLQRTVGSDYQTELSVSTTNCVIHLHPIEIHLASASAVIDSVDVLLGEVGGLCLGATHDQSPAQVG